MHELNKKIFSTLFFSVFTAVLGVGIVVPLLPVYAHDIGASGLYIAAIFGSFSFSRTIFLPYFGRLSDKKGRKIFISTGLFFYAIISIGFLFAKNVETLIIVRLFQGIGSAMIMPVTQAYIGDITPPGKEGFIMGAFNMAVFMGLSAGPLIGGIINDKLSLNASFITMGILSATGFLVSIFWLPPTKTEKKIYPEKKPAPWHKIFFDKQIAGFFAYRFSYALCIGISWGFLPLLADMKFNLSSSSIGFLVMTGVAISGLLHIPMGYMADKMNKTLMVSTGGLIAGTAFLLFARANNINDLFWGNILFGIGGGISMPALMALVVVKGRDSGAMGSVMGFITMAHSLGMLIGAFLAGIIMDISYLSQAFLAGAWVMTAGVILFYVSVLQKK